jgi:hypothetical protein
MLTLEEAYTIEVNQEKKLLSKPNADLKHLASSLTWKNHVFATYAMAKEHSFVQAKQHFFVGALLDTFRILRFQNRLFDYALSGVCNALLSDNIPFLKEVYANLSYSTTYRDEKNNIQVPITMGEMASEGESAIFVQTIQFFLKDDMAMVERNIDLIETIHLPQIAENPELLEDDLIFFKALHAKDRGKCEEILAKFVSPEVHEKRNENPLLNKYMSQPAMGYAKLAWIMNVPVEVNSSLIQTALLPVNPNTEYKIPYEFLNGLVQDKYAAAVKIS